MPPSLSSLGECGTCSEELRAPAIQMSGTKKLGQKTVWDPMGLGLGPCFALLGSGLVSWLLDLGRGPPLHIPDTISKPCPTITPESGMEIATVWSPQPPRSPINHMDTKQISLPQLSTQLPQGSLHPVIYILIKMMLGDLRRADTNREWWVQLGLSRSVPDLGTHENYSPQDTSSWRTQTKTVFPGLHEAKN